MSDRVPISVVVLTKNEEQAIARCVRSVDFADEILLFDDSTDQTVHVAKKAAPQVKVISSSASDDFAFLRNEALYQAKNKWVLFVDADEEVSDGLASEIKQVVYASPAVGFYIRRKDYFLGKWLRWGETGNMKLLKLGKKDAGKWLRRVHEVWDIKGEVRMLEHELLHYPHPTIAEFLAHINRWTTLDAAEFYSQGKRASFFTIMAYPVGKFLRNYIVKLGFLDGMPGLIMAMMMSFHSFLTRGKLYLLQTGYKPHA